MYKIVIFGYNFFHKKSENFIHILKKNNVDVAAYIAADSVTLDLPKKIYNKSIPQKSIFHPRELCELYNIPFFNLAHNSSKTIDVIKNNNANLGIISGARILKSSVIDSLKYGIINFHPGKIPEASGLDGLMWSIYKNIRPFVTTHFIDSQVDAGRRIFQKEIMINVDDRIEDIKLTMSIAEQEELDKLCKMYLINNLEIKSEKILNYKTANKPMIEKYQLEALDKFDSWKKDIILR